jgi:hypothetical protein
VRRCVLLEGQRSMNMREELVLAILGAMPATISACAPRPQPVDSAARRVAGVKAVKNDLQLLGGGPERRR